MNISLILYYLKTLNIFHMLFRRGMLRIGSQTRDSRYRVALTDCTRSKSIIIELVDLIFLFHQPLFLLKRTVIIQGLADQMKKGTKTL